jgi:hypothetical protein
VAALATSGGLNHLPRNTATPIFLGNDPNTVAVNVSATQQIVASLSATVYAGTGGAFVSYALCYRAAGGAITSFNPGHFHQAPISVNPSRSLLAVNASAAPGVAGTYDVGLCGMNGNYAPMTITEITGWVMVVNPGQP